MSVFPVTLCETRSFFFNPISKLLFMSHWPELGHMSVLTNHCKKHLTNGITWQLRGIVSFPWGCLVGGCMAEQHWGSVRKEEGRCGYWLGIWLKSPQSINFTVIFIITVSIISFCFRLLASYPSLFCLLRVVTLILLTTVSMCWAKFGLCLFWWEGNWNVAFLLPTFSPQPEIPQTKHSRYTELLRMSQRKSISRSQHLSLTIVSCVTEPMT